MQFAQKAIDKDGPSASYAKLLGEITAAVNELDGRDRILYTAMQLLCDAVGWPVGHVMLCTPEGALKSTRVWYVSEDYDDPGFTRFRAATTRVKHYRDVSLPGRALATVTPQWVANGHETPGHPRGTVALAAGLTSALAFPLLRGAEVIGVCECYSPGERIPEANLLEVVAQLGGFLGRALTRRPRRGKDADTSRDAFIEMDVFSRVVEWSPGAEALFGWPREEMVGRRLLDTIVPPRCRPTCTLMRRLETLAARARGVVPVTREVPAIDRSEREFPVEITYWAFEQEGQTRFYCVSRDISVRKRHESELQRHAYHDSLTSLPNRRLLVNRLDQLLTQRDCRKRGLAVLFFDIDRFKRVNDTLGHAAGDEALVAIADRLRQSIRPIDTIARLAGDEFVVACPAVKTPHAAVVFAQRLLAAIGEPVEVDGESLFLTASAGIAMIRAGSSAESLVDAADIAMYRAKQAGRGHCEVFDTRMQAAMVSRLRIENELRNAIDREQLRLYYQPIVTTADGEVAGVEALLRWQHPTRGLLLPAQFVPVAEETGLIVPIGHWVLREVCRQARVWQDALENDRSLLVSFNISSCELERPSFTRTMSKALKAAGVDARRISLGVEVTETVAMRDPDRAVGILRRLKALGIRLFIDDFGVGYSSLAYLKDLPVDVIKIDQSFVRRLVESHRDRTIVRAVTDLAHVMGIEVVAEGVENKAHLKAAHGAGVDFIQGYLFGMPQPAPELTEILRAKPAASPSRVAAAPPRMQAATG